MALKLIQQGAEAKILFDSSKNLIIKDRISKSYRHPNLDAQIRKRRTKSETKLLEKAGKIINVPLLAYESSLKSPKLMSPKKKFCERERAGKVFSWAGGQGQ